MTEMALAPWSDVVPMENLHLHPDNARKGNVGSIAASLERFGQVRPLLVQQQTNTIVAGNHTYLAAQLLGWSEIAVIRLPLSDEDARAYLLTDNRLSDLASYDDDGLLAVLEKVQQAGGLEATGWTIDDMDDLTAALERIPEVPGSPFEGDYAESPEETAERWADRAEGQNREIVFLLSHERYEQFKANVAVLQTRWELDTLSDTVFEALARAAAD